MSIAFECLHCGKSYQSPDHLAGKTIRCRACGESIDVPTPMRPPTAAKPQPAPPSRTVAPAPPVTKERPASQPKPQQAARPAETPSPKPPLQVLHTKQVPSTATPGLAATTQGPPAAAPRKPAARSRGQGPNVLIEAVLGLLMLLGGGLLQWGYGSMVRVETSADYYEKMKAQREASQTPPSYRSGPGRAGQPGPAGSGGAGEFGGQRPPFIPPNLPNRSGPPPRPENR